MGDSESSLSQCSEDEDTEDVDLTNKDTLFPIFYKDKAQTGEGTGEGGDAPRSSGIGCVILCPKMVKIRTIDFRVYILSNHKILPLALFTVKNKTIK